MLMMMKNDFQPHKTLFLTIKMLYHFRKLKDFSVLEGCEEVYFCVRCELLVKLFALSDSGALTTSSIFWKALYRVYLSKKAEILIQKVWNEVLQFQRLNSHAKSQNSSKKLKNALKAHSNHAAFHSIFTMWMYCKL